LGTISRSSRRSGTRFFTADCGCHVFHAEQINAMQIESVEFC